MWKYFLFLGIFANLSLIHGFNEQRIGGSEITPPDLFQFTIRAGCTTSVISKRHLLDAAHCLFRGETRIEMHDTYKIYWDAPYYAEVRSTREGVNRSIVPVSKKVYVPKNYVIPNNTYDDIAVLEFPEGTDFGVEPVKLARDYFEKEGDESYIVGFGVWWENGSVTSGGSDVLRHAKVTMVENCWGTLRICGGNRTHRAFVGDSGGPMVINRNNQWYQIGVSAGTASMEA
uniref:Peptidase S1 domain-containing protein n=1 Tax=Panagrolaimus superbus TaxID=310955 RepID=A0A914ZCY7_9BILA